HSLPASLYLSSRPSWWASASWPAIGPDVSGLAQSIPAQSCYQSQNLATTDNFDANTCYYGAPPSPISGSCSTTLNQCTLGTFSDVTDTSSNYLWSCTGSNGGTTAQ